MKAPRRNSGFGWVGTWDDGKLGWVVPLFISSGFRGAERPHSKVDFVGDDDVFYKCRITITPVRGKKTGKLVSRRYRSLKEES